MAFSSLARGEAQRLPRVRARLTGQFVKPNLWSPPRPTFFHTSYDAAGNQTRSLAADGVHWLLYEYDAANRLQVVKEDGTTPTTIQGLSYGSTNAKLIENNYTAGGVKIFASVGGTTMAEYTEYTSTVPTWTKSYTYFGDTQLATVTPNGSGGEYIEFNHPDRLGTRLITNQAGGTSYEQTHLPFGTDLNAESTGSTNNRFTSYDRSAPTGLDYALNRTYDSKLGRFTQVDPIRMGDSSLANPQSFNLYSYCQNDPINHLDPSGLGFFSFLKKLLKWAMIAITVLVVVALIIIAAAIVAAVVFDVLLPSFLGGSGFLGALLGIFQSIGIGASSFAAGAFGIEISSSTGGAYALGLLFGVGAIANSFQNDDKKKKKPKHGSPLEIRMTFFKLYGKKFNKCLKQIFKKDYKKIGRQTFGNSPILDATQSSAEVGANSGSGQATGSSDPFYGKHGKVMMDNVSYRSRGWNARKAVFGTYAHEVANILDIRINPNEPQATYGRVYGNPNDDFDTDTGARVERCLFGGLQYPNQIVK